MSVLFLRTQLFCRPPSCCVLHPAVAVLSVRRTVSQAPSPSPFKSALPSMASRVPVSTSQSGGLGGGPAPPARAVRGGSTRRVSWRRADQPGRAGGSAEVAALANVRKAASADGSAAAVPSAADGAKQLRCAAAGKAAPTQCAESSALLNMTAAAFSGAKCMQQVSVVRRVVRDPGAVRDGRQSDGRARGAGGRSGRRGTSQVGCRARLPCLVTAQHP